MQQQSSSWSMPIVTVVSVLFAIVLAFLGSGALGGTPIGEAADGALSADATPFAPAGPAFSIWSAIYLGLVVYAIFRCCRISARRSGKHNYAPGQPYLPS